MLEATEWYALGFEIIDCVFPDWKFQPADFVAARGLHAALVIGEPVYVEPEDIAGLVTDMAAFTVRLLKNNEMVEEGAAKNALKSPVLCVAELAEALKRRGGETLQAGDIISTGTLTTSLPIAAGDIWIASLSGIPPSSLHASRGVIPKISGASGIAAPSWRGSDAPKWTPDPSLITACPCPKVPVRGGTIVTSWPSAVSSLRTDAGTSASTLTSAPSNVALREPARLERLLNVHPVVDDVGDELSVGLRLVEAAHDAEADARVAALHEARE